MFTGLIEETGVIEKREGQKDGISFTIRAQRVLTDLKEGDSISINGACQTVMEIRNRTFTVFSIPETLRVTHFASLKTGDEVNLERPLAVGERLGGHFVQGHVEGTGEIQSIEKGDNHWRVAIHYPSPYIIPKGSIAVDGISLTVQKIDGPLFWVELIPETLKRTNARRWELGYRPNIETDYFVKVIHHLLGERYFSK
ncbi:MAG: riboflavin synthase [Leptospiraceae bacterium]|nr:riboflavin synthase [Leptospiraceae bacterium]MDW8306739.1 riboflavin synthase [Leptospiraceae bacterium]